MVFMVLVFLEFVVNNFINNFKVVFFFDFNIEVGILCSIIVRNVYKVVVIVLFWIVVLVVWWFK